MKIKKGVPASPGYSIATAVVLDSERPTIQTRSISNDMVAVELERLDAAIATACQEVERVVLDMSGDFGTDFANIFQAHTVMLKDPILLEEFKNLITKKQNTAEYAVVQTLRRYAKEFMAMDDDFFRHRVSDIRDIEKRLTRILMGTKTEDFTQAEGIIISSELTPMQTAALDTSKIKGFGTDSGGRTDHTSIMARALGLPAVVGLKDMAADVTAGDVIIVDGVSGLVVIDPDAVTLKKYRRLIRNYQEHLQQLDKLNVLEAVTTDGTHIDIFANIEFPREIARVLDKGGAGIGLYRTEFMYSDFRKRPTEQEQFKIYKKSLRELKSLPLVVRTLDLGGDKLFEKTMEVEKNPFLGCRSIRLCLERLDIFKPQLRALLRAAVEGDLWILLPMISSVDELKKVRVIIEDIKIELAEEGIEFQHKVKLGIMVEIPSTVMIMDILIDMVDFVSIGTNDLVQYTLAVDRVSDQVADYYQTAHPAILRMIKHVVDICDKAGKHVTLCGEMAAEPMYIPLLLGLGIRNVSVTPFSLPEVKEVIRAISIETANEIAAECLTFKRQREINAYLKRNLRLIMEASAANTGVS